MRTLVAVLSGKTLRAKTSELVVAQIHTRPVVATGLRQALV